MAIYNVAAKWNDSNGRVWRGIWKRRARSAWDANKRAEADLELIGGKAMTVRVGACIHQTGVSVIGKSGRIMAIEHGGEQSSRAIRYSIESRVTRELTENERRFVWGQVWDLL